MSNTVDARPELVQLAESLEKARTSGVSIPTPSDTLVGFTIDEAYAVQRMGVRQRLAQGERIVGRKIGLTSLPMQQQLGVDQPDFGVITDRMVVADGGRIDSGFLVAPRLEAEFAFRMARDVPVNPSLDQLASAIGQVMLSIEIIDSRVRDWKITIVDTIADNASAAAIVAGEGQAASPQLLASLPETVLSFTRDDEVVGRGPGSAVLGDPLVSLHWLAGAIGAYGESFAAGDIVLAGAVDRAVDLSSGHRWQVNAHGFESVTLMS